LGDDDGEGLAAPQGVISPKPRRSVVAQVRRAVRKEPEAEDELR
jgi:hypothetical protein